MTSAKQLVAAKPWQLEITEGLAKPVDPACVGVAENLEPVQILGLALSNGLQHICQKKGHMYDEEVASSEALIAAQDSYLEFPVASILDPSNVNQKAERKHLVLDEHFDRSSQKQEIYDKVSSTMTQKGIARTVMDEINAVADEMFTNALYNAPFVDLSTHKNPGVSRQNLEIKLDGGKFGRIFLAHSEKRLIIGCEDPFGSLDLRHFLSRIKSTYERGPAATMNFGPGGAGIGSYIIFNAGASLYFGVAPGRVTILCCVIPLGMSNRQRTNLPKHLHWFQR
jgi:hypothetical protein